MNKSLFIRIFICILFLGACLYSYLDMQNEITELRIRVPELTKAVRRIEEENTRLLYEIKAFESPENLMKLAGKSEYAYLKYPMQQDVMVLTQASPFKESEKPVLKKQKTQRTITFATGSNP